MANIYDTINQLERDIRDSQAYKDLDQAMDQVCGDQEALRIYKQFRNLQKKFQEQMEKGQQISQDDISLAQSLQTQMQGNATIANLMQKEQALNQTVSDINLAVSRPIQDIYEKADKTIDA